MFLKIIVPSTNNHREVACRDARAVLRRVATDGARGQRASGEWFGPHFVTIEITTIDELRKHNSYCCLSDCSGC